MKIAEGTPGILKDTAADTGNRQEAHMCKINLSLLSLLRALYWLKPQQRSMLDMEEDRNRAMIEVIESEALVDCPICLVAESEGGKFAVVQAVNH